MALTDNLLASYNFDQTSGNLVDALGNYNLTNSNTVGYAAGLIGNCGDFGSSNSNKRFYQNSSAMGVDGGAFSVSMWVKARASIPTNGFWVLFSQSNPGTDTQQAVYYRDNAGTPYLQFTRDKWAVASNKVDHNITLSTSAWTHIVYTHTGSLIEGFVNGVSIGTVATSGNGTGLPYTGFSLGAAVDTDTFGNASVYMDNVQAWNRAITSAEVTQLYNSGAGLQYPFSLNEGLQAYYKLDDSSGNATDSSGNSRTLTNNNSVAYATGKLNNGADFGSSNSTKTLSRTDALGLTSGSMSMSMWFKVVTHPASGELQTHAIVTSTRYYVIRYLNSGGTRYLRFIGAGSSEGVVELQGDLALNTWYQATLTYNASTGVIKGYLNGVLLGTATNSTASSYTPRTVFGGATTSAEFWKGMIDEVGVWNRELSYAEVWSIYKNNVGQQYPLAMDPGILPDAISTGSGTGTSVTWSHTVSGKDNVLVVGLKQNNTANNVTGVTYGGTSMTLIGTVAGASFDRVYLYQLTNPPLGTNTISVSVSTSRTITGRAASYNNTQQTGQPETSTTLADGSGTDTTTTVTTTTNGDWIVGIFMNNNANYVAGTDTVMRAGAPSSVILMDSNAPRSPGSNTIAGTWSGSSDSLAVTAAIIPSYVVYTRRSDFFLFMG